MSGLKLDIIAKFAFGGRKKQHSGFYHHHHLQHCAPPPPSHPSHPSPPRQHQHCSKRECLTTCPDPYSNHHGQHHHSDHHHHPGHHLHHCHHHHHPYYPQHCSKRECLATWLLSRLLHRIIGSDLHALITTRVTTTMMMMMIRSLDHWMMIMAKMKMLIFHKNQITKLVTNS